ncbi:metallopeptidase family protein [Parvularcula sp. LCG005]|uniref:metallopeptidase family protein n=1 Tax=Parvularcula sp. LCG005 TaxID=3078805 RepID=UPI002943CF46|nr:metallopeptidase family protein [Parvularcula sp. LCG005]WOI52138.1 metallopeptidase family protein [Parvularcula sp. LCG005]
MTDLSADHFESVVREVYNSLPEAFRTLSKDVHIRVVDYADDETLARLGISHPDGLLGLYHGVDVTRKSLFDVATQPDMVFLYRKPMIRYWREGSDSLEKVIAHVLVHEIGHHFGLSDDDMHALEDEA